MIKIKTDWNLFLTILAMVCFGLVMVYSSSSVVAEMKYKSSAYFLLHQVGWAACSLLVLMWLKKQDYTQLKAPIWAFSPLGVVLVLLVVVYFLDSETHRWLRLGVGSLQPSELAKPALILFLAYFVARRSSAINDNRYTLAPAALVVTLLSIFVGIADLGTAVVLIATAGVVFYVAGLDRRYCRMAIAVMTLFVAAAIVAKPYRLGRLIAYIDPDYKYISMVDPNGYVKNYVHAGTSTRDAGYQGRQGRIAMGSGGIFGLGLMGGKQKLFFLPEAHTDFIYAIVGEELGLWGTSAVLAGFIIILWRGIRLFLLCPDDFGRYLALGATATVVFQALINISVVLELGPTKGIPLPMISYGGSSLLSTLISLGLLLNVSERVG